MKVKEFWDKHLGGVFIALALIAIALWFGWGLYLVGWFADRWGGSSDALARLGQTGDLFGGINALFAAFAFVGVAYAAILQSRALAITREQHARQSFEPLFFHLLTLHREIEQDIVLLDLPEGWPDTGSPRCDLAFVARALYQAIGGARWGTIAYTDDVEEKRELLLPPYLSLYAVNEGTLGPYFRSLYHIFKLIHRSDLTQDEKVSYANIARAILGTDAIFLLSIDLKLLAAMLTHRFHRCKDVLKRQIRMPVQVQFRFLQMLGYFFAG